MTNNDTSAYTAQEGQANLYAGSGNVSSESLGSGLFVWLTVTMLWVLMILAIMALLKYVTEGGSTKGRGRASKSG